MVYAGSDREIRLPRRQIFHSGQFYAGYDRQPDSSR